MATYAIGDIQGCFTPLQKLLDKISFNPAQDTLWFTGDLVNRGPHSLKVLRFVKQLGAHQKTVLGNHDLHLLAVAYGTQKVSQHDTLNDILTAPDKDELIDWLRHCPLIHHDPSLGFTMTHAGIAPSWSIDKALLLASEVATVLQSATPQDFLQAMYGNQPDHWDDRLSGWDRLRCITNYFTRMRFCHPDGRLNLCHKGMIAKTPKELIPWFQFPHRVSANDKLIFGHWAALSGVTNTPRVYALDTGCAWGCQLSGLRLEDE